MTQAIEVPIRDNAIKLGQLVKLAGAVEDGVQARLLIEDGRVKVDGEVVLQRARQVHLESIVEVDGQAYRVTTG